MMKLLLDTHILLWWLTQDRKLSQTEVDIITEPDNLVFVSAATGWEIAVKKMIGKLEAPDDLPAALAANNFLELPIKIEHSQQLYRLPLYHQDPFDRMMIAQAMSEDLTLMTRDTKIALYDIRII
jgi:PIN domain nuclease of toxin-antitoxin system